MSIAFSCRFIVNFSGSYGVFHGKPVAPILLLTDDNCNELGLLQPKPLYIVFEGPIANFAPLLLAHSVGLPGLFVGLLLSLPGFLCLSFEFHVLLPLSTFRYVWTPCAQAFCLHVCARPAVLAFAALAYFLRPLSFAHNLNY